MPQVLAPMTGLSQHAHQVPAAMARPQVGIERLPARRMSNEPRESMNCKSCRKRKIKCNRLRPACEACQVFQCPCIYDAVPKKRGPKTDVLEALLKRVDGLEAKLKEKASTDDKDTGDTDHIERKESTSQANPEKLDDESRGAKRLAIDPEAAAASHSESAILSPDSPSEPPPHTISQEALLDVYFSRIHTKPFHILDESAVRQRSQLKQLPLYLVHAICAVAARYTSQPDGLDAATALSDDYASRSRADVDVDEPSIDALQALLLLVLAFTSAGKGKKAYMLMTTAVGMALALETHREMDTNTRVTPTERETRRRLFWTCYLLDRFMACGSRRPSLLVDKTVFLRLPSWSPNPASLPVDGEFFQTASNLQYIQGSGKKPQGSTGMLIDIARILGITNRYLAAGGVKGDSHFPWHSLSNLSRIRQDLDVWASGTEDVFSSLDRLFNHGDATVLVLGKLVYHLIHCLIYRPFLPIDLSELAGSGQHQSWQIEATHMCFLHANAIAELVELSKQAGTIEWPAFVSFCICTAGTVHVHGAHYTTNSNDGQDSGKPSAFGASAEFLSREMQQLSDLTMVMLSASDQRRTLQAIYAAHFELVKSLANSPMMYSPAFHLEDFFDRYNNMNGYGTCSFAFDAASLGLSDMAVDVDTIPPSGSDAFTVGCSGEINRDAGRPQLKRRSTSNSTRRQSVVKSVVSLGRQPERTSAASQSAAMAPPTGRPSFDSHFSAMPQQQQLSALFTATPFRHMPQRPGQHSRTPGPLGTGQFNSIQGFDKPQQLYEQPHSEQPQQQQQQQHENHQQSHSHPSLTAAIDGSFSPNFNFPTPGSGILGDVSGPYDPMFGTLPTNAFSSPAAWQDNSEGRHGGTGAILDAPIEDMGQRGDAVGNTSITSKAVAPSPDTTNGSTGTGPGDEKDPFLSLLEQMAENEHQFSRGQNSEFDFFFGTIGGGGSGGNSNNGGGGGAGGTGR